MQTDGIHRRNIGGRISAMLSNRSLKMQRFRKNGAGKSRK